MYIPLNEYDKSQLLKVFLLCRIVCGEICLHRTFISSNTAGRRKRFRFIFSCPSGSGHVNSRIYIGVFVVFSLSLSSIQGLATSDPIQITPSQITIDTVAGNTTTINLTIENTGNKKLSCQLETQIAPDGIGINITYNKSHFVLSPQEIQQMNMTITLAPHLQPGTYTITTTWLPEETAPKKKSPGGTTTADTGWTPPHEPPTDTDDEPDDESPPDDDETDGDTTEDPPPYIPPNEETEQEDDLLQAVMKNITHIFIGLALIFGVIVIALLFLFKRKKPE